MLYALVMIKKPETIITNIDGCPAYPIFSFNLRWKQDASDDPAHGRMNNSTGQDHMFRQWPTEKEIKCLVDELKASRKELSITKMEVKFSFLRFETWCLGWFNHCTFDDGRSNAEFMRSFDNYVDRCSRNEIQLMGAEDRWRWTTSDGSELPCRCDGCKSLEMVRVGH